MGKREAEKGERADDPKAEQTSRELDAQQLAQRIIALTGSDTPASYEYRQRRILVVLFSTATSRCCFAR